MIKNKTSIDIVFCDLDHTLVALATQTTTTLNAQAIKELKAKNKKFVIATGRSLERAVVVGRNLDADYGVFSSGGVIYSFANQKITRVFSLDGKRLQELLEPFVGVSAFFATFYCANSTNELVSFYFGKENVQFWEQKVDLSLFQQVQTLQQLQRWKVFRINLYGEHAVLKAIANKLNADQSFYWVFNYPTVLEINAKNVNKGSAVTFLLKMLNLSGQQAVAFGDGANDIEMFQAVKYGIAVKNANPLLKQVAFQETDSYDQSGVGKALYKWFL